MKGFQTYRRVIFSVALFLVLSAAADARGGTLQFYANGEDLITAGFTSPKLTKDGWTLQFDHVYVTLGAVTAWQTSPPFRPEEGTSPAIMQEAVLPGIHTVDLARGTADDPPVLVGEVTGAPQGHYNALSWRMVRAEEGPAAGYSLLMIGVAGKDGSKVPFRIASDREYGYRCGEFVGDERKGFLDQGGTADLEITFHFDHLFGRADKPLDGDMNRQAPGFEVLSGGPGETVIVDTSGLHLGHAGEGHCAVHE